MQENVSNCQVCFSNLKLKLFSHVSVIFTVIQNVWLATNSQNAILNNFEDYFSFLIALSVYEKRPLQGDLSHVTFTGFKHILSISL